METKFNSQICTTREQSEKLIALGLKKETADMSYKVTTHDFKGNEIKEKDRYYILCCWYDESSQICGLEKKETITAWSLHRLIEMMPKCVRAHSSGDDSPRLHPYVPKFDYYGVTIENIDEILVDFYQHTDLFDNLIECIEWLIKEGYFPKEYLV